MNRVYKTCLIGLLIFGVLILYLSYRFVPQRRGHTLTGDMKSYLAMTEGNFKGAKPPFTHRVLIPFMAHQLPLDSYSSFALIVIISFIFLVPSIFVLCQVLKIPTEPSLWVSYVFALANIGIGGAIILTDIPAILMTVIFLILGLTISTQKKQFNLKSFVLALFPSLMASNRETSGILVFSLFSLPGNLLGIVAFVILSITLILIREIIPLESDTLQLLSKGWHSSVFSRDLVMGGVGLAEGFGFLWPWFILGLPSLIKKHSFLKVAFILSAISATCSVLLASDTSRMISTNLWPFCCIGCANFFVREETVSIWLSRLSKVLRYAFPLVLAMAKADNLRTGHGFSLVRIFLMLFSLVLTKLIIDFKDR